MDTINISGELRQRSPWCGESTFRGSRRALSLIDAVVWQKLGKSAVLMTFDEKKRALEHVYVDISQNHIRRPFTNDHRITGTLTTSTMLYSFGRDGFVLPLELLFLHGHSRALKVPESVKRTNLKSLAGEGMALPCIGSVLWAGLLVRQG